MTPEQEAMFRLQADPGYQPPTPGEAAVPIPADSAMIEDGVVDAVQGGMGMSWQWMARNGPVRPVTSRRPSTITKGQLQEQKERENMGLPSNETEATRVVALEQKVDQLVGMMTNILQAKELAVPTAGPSGGPPPTPPERPDAVPSVTHPGFPPMPETSSLTLELVVPPMGLPEAVGSPGEFHGPLERPMGAPVETMGELAQRRRGEVGAVLPIPPDPLREEPVVTTEELTEPVMLQEPVPDPLLEKTQALAGRVSTWLAAKDPLRYWKSYTGGLNKNLAFNTWPPEMQARFQVRFNQLLKDSSFVSAICQHMVQFQNGHMLGEGVAAGFVVVIAGMLAFTVVGT